MRVLLRELKGHIEGYGLLSDLCGDTYFGIPQKEIDKYEKVWTEFEVDELLPKYCVGSKDPTIYDIGYTEIPVGTLRVYGLPKPSKFSPLIFRRDSQEGNTHVYQESGFSTEAGFTEDKRYIGRICHFPEVCEDFFEFGMVKLTVGLSAAELLQLAEEVDREL